MTTHHFAGELWLPRKREQIFEFFSEARNLQRITPPWLKFEVLEDGPMQIRQGTLIDYRLRVHGIPMRWQSEITCWEPPQRFVDEQRRGPYRVWKHTHSFEERDSGTLCRDDVEYAVPGGWLVNWLLVRRDIQSIFKYREKMLRQIFV